MRSLLLGLLLAALPLVAGCASPASESVRFRDVHAIAVLPDDPDGLLVATHHGLFRGGEAGFRRVGPSQDDLMGFVLHPTDGRVAWSSGHAAPGSGGPANLGVRRSLDGGASWHSLGMPGADFHAMTVSPANPDVLWGHWRGTLYRSVDGGVSWKETQGSPGQVVALAADPLDADAVYATIGVRVSRSEDGGRTWANLADEPALGLAVRRDGGLLLAAFGSHVARSTDGGRTWSHAEVGPEARVAFVAIAPSDPDVAWAASYEGAVWRSLDAGATWRQVKPVG